MPNKMNASLYLLAVATALLVAIITDIQALCDPSRVEASVLFHCQVERSSFFQDSPPVDSVSVEVSAAQQGFAGIPDWLTLLQVNQTTAAVLYGTPQEEDVGDIAIQLTARRMDTFASETRQLQLTIDSPKGRFLLMSELVLLNYKMEDFLRAELYSRFNTAVNDAFQTNQSLILQVVHPATRGLSNQRTIVVVTPGVNVSTVSMATAEEANSVQSNCDSRDGDISRPPSNYEAFNLAGFDIDWCRYTLYAVESRNSSNNEGGGEPTDEGTDPVRPTPEGSSISLVVVVVVFSVVIVMMVTGLAWVFLGGRKRAFYIPRERKERRATMADETYTASKDTAEAQRQLRGLAQAPLSARQQTMTAANGLTRVEGRAVSPVGSTDDELLEYHDVTDYGGADNARLPRSPPPAYQYPEEVLPQTLQHQHKRYRLITL